MNKTICGDGIGYLIPKKEFEEKLRQRFEELKDKYIVGIGTLISRGVSVGFIPQSRIKKAKDCFIVPEVRNLSALVFEKKILKEIFSLKEDIVSIEPIEEFEKGKFRRDFRDDFNIDTGDNLFYFLNTKEEPYYEVIAEIKE